MDDESPLPELRGKRARPPIAKASFCVQLLRGLCGQIRYDEGEAAFDCIGGHFKSVVLQAFVAPAFSSGDKRERVRGQHQ
jgi:hypothetical protein